MKNRTIMMKIMVIVTVITIITIITIMITIITVITIFIIEPIIGEVIMPLVVSGTGHVGHHACHWFYLFRIIALCLKQ